MMNWTAVCKSGDLEAVRRAAAEWDVNERDERGRTPLMLLLTHRMPVAALELLLERGADLEAEDRLKDTALKKAVKFKQKEAVVRLAQAGARLDSPRGLLDTAWNMARKDRIDIADLLLETSGAVRMTLTAAERQQLDDTLDRPADAVMCQRIRSIDSPVVLHAVVNGYNWDDGPEPMLAALRNPGCMEITKLDMYELLEGDYWLGLDEAELAKSEENRQWRALAEELRASLDRFLSDH